jgi:hypothetical protein
MPLTIAGTPGAGPWYRLYTASGPDPSAFPPVRQATTNAPAASNFFTYTSQWVPLYFASTLALAPGTWVRVTTGESTNSDTSGKYNNTEYQWDSDPNSTALMPFQGTLAKTLSVDGTNFTDTSTTLQPFALLLDANSPFSSGSTTSSMLVHPGMYGGMRG